MKLRATNAHSNLVFLVFGISVSIVNDMVPTSSANVHHNRQTRTYKNPQRVVLVGG